MLDSGRANHGSSSSFFFSYDCLLVQSLFLFHHSELIGFACFLCMRRPRKFCQRGSNSDNVFFFFFFFVCVCVCVCEGREDPNNTKNGSMIVQH